MALGLRPPEATIYEDEAVISPVAVPDHTEVISSCSTVIKNGTRAQAGHVSDVAVKSEVADGSTVPDLSVEGHVGADGCVTKCICGYYHDDGYMVCCDRCLVWQHVDCIRIGKIKLPKTYYCHDCDPRELNVERARNIQYKKYLALEKKRKREEAKAQEKLRKQLSQSGSPDKPCPSKDFDDQRESGCSDHESSDSDDSQADAFEDDIVADLPDFSSTACKHILHDHVQSTRLVEPAKIKPRRWKRTISKSMPDGKNELLTYTNEIPLEGESCDSGFCTSSEVWNSSQSPWTSKFEPVICNEYSSDLSDVLRQHLDGIMPKTEGLTSASEGTNDTKAVDRQPCAGTSDVSPAVCCALKEVRPNRQGIVATESIPSNTLILEYKGSMSTRATFDSTVSEPPWIARPLPYVLFYNGFENIELVVDARSIGNLARYIRRSCSPNAEIRHFVADGSFHIGIYSLCDISVDEEITIKFDYPFERCHFPLECSCPHSSVVPSTCHVEQFSARFMTRLKESIIGKSYLDRLLLMQQEHILHQQKLHEATLAQDNTKQRRKPGPKPRPRGDSSKSSMGPDIKRPRRMESASSSKASASLSGSPTDEPEKDFLDNRKRSHTEEDGSSKKRKRPSFQDVDETSNQSVEDAEGEDGSSLKKPSREDRKMEAILKQFQRLEGKSGPARRKSEEVPTRGKRPSVSTPTTPTPAVRPEKQQKTPALVKSRRGSKSLLPSKRPIATQQKRSNPEVQRFTPSPDSSSCSSFTHDASTPLLLAAEAAYQEEEDSTTVGVQALLELATANPAPQLSEQPVVSVSLPSSAPMTPAATTPVSADQTQSGTSTPRLPLKKITAKSWSAQDTKPSTLDLQPVSEASSPMETSPVASVGMPTPTMITTETKPPPQAAAPPSTQMFSPVVGSAKKRWLQNYQAMPSPLSTATQATEGSGTGNPLLPEALRNVSANTPALDTALTESSPESAAARESPKAMDDSPPESGNLLTGVVEEEKMDVSTGSEPDSAPPGAELAAAASEVEPNTSVSREAPVAEEPQALSPAEGKNEEMPSENRPATPIPGSPLKDDTTSTPLAEASTSVPEQSGVSMYEDLSPVSDMAASSPRPTEIVPSTVSRTSGSTGELEAVSPMSVDDATGRQPPGKEKVDSPRTPPPLTSPTAPGTVAAAVRRHRSSVSETSSQASSPGAAAGGVDFRRTSSRSSRSDPRSRTSLDSPSSASTPPTKSAGVSSMSAVPAAAPVGGIPATKKKVSLSEYRRRTLEVRQPAPPSGHLPRSPLLSRVDSNPLSPVTPRSPQSPPPLPDDAMAISPPPPPGAASPTEIDLSSAPPPLFLSSKPLSSQSTPSVSSTSAKTGRELPVYEPVSPDIDVESPPDTSLYSRSMSGHSTLSSSGRDPDQRWPERKGGLPGLKVSPLSDADDDADVPTNPPMEHATFTCLPTLATTATRPAVAAATLSTLPQPKSFAQRRQKMLQSAHSQVNEYPGRNTVAASGTVPHAGAVPVVATSMQPGYTTISPPGPGHTMSRDPRQVASDPRQAAGSAGRSTHDPRQVAQYMQVAGAPQSAGLHHQGHHHMPHHGHAPAQNPHLQQQQQQHSAPHRHGQAPGASHAAGAAVRRSQPLLQTPGQQQASQQQFPFQSHSYFHS